jgi:hypothetical protein
MDAKKDKERKIFDFVYSDRVLKSVTPNEEPDFKVENKDGEFGVEITEFYYSHSVARLNNIPTYLTEIIKDRKYRHKDDMIPLLKTFWERSTRHQKEHTNITPTYEVSP